METVIKLPDVEAVQNFVKVATETDCDVLVLSLIHISEPTRPY